MMRATILTFLLGFATLSGCVFPGVHKLNIQQGNIVTQDMLDQLHAGMTAHQVEFVMGTPVLQNPFNSQRWDYIYTLEERDEITKQYHIQVFFDDQGNYMNYTGTLPNATFSEQSQLDSLPQEETSVNTIPVELTQ
ncbi:MULTISPECIES: outer membrane protein assembly factor BamE [unclassified Oceanobacter]|jgi:outer membrane protein assembly factor BamE|uniref:outer membrane protein assembly factor BamE n=1 Tax=unclassified Oceanobacter TaxID=2620260 RepID=UPI0026E3B093|nr:MULTISPECIES: outer membrane protein assembly factor BamE [unclassified Oceanobacter]MDO6681372.1 outer membrane protein assembly factor BamE [Oceanobacter sp. 5_MG-2023]MDP2505081.1 outer membrane protein assembly factor BamE [Oceanobacter sp. 3_MG-2023]MDP2548205.1 outer membrane protein assembly factor BamE [Oceanobacter sp. 4_MG-2023]MDP2608127.1 outer membrane protein assembly factor BamE [Oceanobacter sp. 1_MG-2023]MDP2611211.1 outer membrane protein assembly factor BamE [Oceanobacter